MTKKEIALLVHYNMRNHVGAMALKEDENSDIHRCFYKRLKEKRYSVLRNFIKLRDAERMLNEKLKKEGRMSLNEAYDQLIDFIK